MCAFKSPHIRSQGVCVSSRWKSICNIFNWFEMRYMQFFRCHSSVLSLLFIVNRERVCASICFFSRYEIIHISFYRIHPVKTDDNSRNTEIMHVCVVIKSQKTHIFYVHTVWGSDFEPHETFFFSISRKYSCERSGIFEIYLLHRIHE